MGDFYVDKCDPVDSYAVTLIALTDVGHLPHAVRCPTAELNPSTFPLALDIYWKPCWISLVLRSAMRYNGALRTS